MEGEGQPGRRADGLHGVLGRRASVHRDDADASSRAGAGAVWYWLPYFQVADCDASFAKAKQLGAGVIVAPQDIPSTGRFAVLADRQGAMFAIFTFARG